MSANRRDSDELTEDIMNAIAGCDDPNMKAVLLIVHNGFAKLSSKIDAVLSDEETIKNIVLNGHSATFSDDMTWLHSFRMSRPNGKCPYVVRMEAAEELVNRSKRKVFESVAAHAITAITSILAAWLVTGMYMSTHP